MNTNVPHPVAAHITAWFREENGLDHILRATLALFQAQTGTLHRLDPATQQLHLVAQIGVPPQLLNIVQLIPVGKGIAGQTVVQNRPVTICNLQTDASGVAKPGAKQTGVGGAISVPVRRDGAIVGTLGVGIVQEHDYTPAEIESLEAIATALGKIWP